MSQKLIAVASQLFCTPVFQNNVKNSTFKPERFVLAAIAGARNFIEVCEEMGFTGNPMVALSHYSNRLGDGLFDYQDPQMRQLAKAAIEVAVEFERVISREIGEPEKQVVKAPEKPADAPKLVDVAIEQCNLPTAIVETLTAAGHVTAQAVIDADAQGKIVGLPGIGPATRDKLLGKLKEAMTAAALLKEATDKGSETVAS